MLNSHVGGCRLASRTLTGGCRCDEGHPGPAGDNRTAGPLPPHICWTGIRFQLPVVASAVKRREERVQEEEGCRELFSGLEESDPVGVGFREARCETRPIIGLHSLG